jgi:hypothetical protein
MYGTEHPFVRDWIAGTTSRVDVATDGTPGNFASLTTAITADGRSVAFNSGSSNLVPGDTNRTWDVFVRDRGRGTSGCGSTATSENDRHTGRLPSAQ